MKYGYNREGRGALQWVAGVWVIIKEGFLDSYSSHCFFEALDVFILEKYAFLLYGVTSVEKRRAGKEDLPDARTGVGALSAVSAVYALIFP